MTSYLSTNLFLTFYAMYKFFRKTLLLILTLSALSGCATTHHLAKNHLTENNAEQKKPDISASPKQSHDDLWQQVSSQFSNSVDQSSPRIDYYVTWFSKHPVYFEQLMERARPYLYYIMQEVNKRQMPSELALVPAVESAFDPFAYSNGLASGLWQITPATGQYYKVKQDWWFDGRRDVITATNFALDYLQELHEKFNSWELALAAYNAGNGTIGRAIQANLKQKKSISYWHLDLPNQTVNYVPKLLAVAKIVQNPSLYKIKLKPISNIPFFQIIEVGSQIDLKRAAEMANMSLKEMRQLNPGYNRWATDPAGPYRLLIPVDNAPEFKKALASLPVSERINWQRYTVHTSDTLDSIAKIFNIDPDVIRKINRLPGSKIYIGDHLLIPQPIADNAELTSAQQALAITEAKNIISDNRGQLREIYTVKPGDNLSTIAGKHNLSHTQIMKWNHLSEKSLLHPEQKLILWIGQNNMIRHTYAVKSGDTLWNIAKKYKTSIDQLSTWNNLDTLSYLQPKQKLYIWSKPDDSAFKTRLSHSTSIIRRVFYKVRKGESLNRIANKFRVAPEQISQWNTLKNHHIKPGQQLTLFVDVTHTG